jgi:hypothetical protein
VKPIALLMAFLVVVSACGSEGSENSGATNSPGEAQVEMARWASASAERVGEATGLAEQCEVMDSISKEFFGRADAAVFSAAMDPGLASGSATQLLLVVNEGGTFCSWTVPDEFLIGEAVTSMSALLSDLSVALVGTPST